MLRCKWITSNDAGKYFDNSSPQPPLIPHGRTQVPNDMKLKKTRNEMRGNTKPPVFCFLFLWSVSFQYLFSVLISILSVPCSVSSSFVLFWMALYFLFCFCFQPYTLTLESGLFVSAGVNAWFSIQENVDNLCPIVLV